MYISSENQMSLEQLTEYRQELANIILSDRTADEKYALIKTLEKTIQAVYDKCAEYAHLTNLMINELIPDDVSIPRMRTSFFAVDDMEGHADEEKLTFILRTRTGGGNWDEYYRENKALSRLPLCIYDCDESSDCTYRSFYFDVDTWAQQYGLGG